MSENKKKKELELEARRERMTDALDAIERHERMTNALERCAGCMELMCKEIMDSKLEEEEGGKTIKENS